jgi:hypothetical protein
VLHTIFGLKEDPNYKFSLKKLDVGNVVIILIFAKRNEFQYKLLWHQIFTIEPKNHEMWEFFILLKWQPWSILPLFTNHKKTLFQLLSSLSL